MARPRKYQIARQIYFVWYAMCGRCNNLQHAAYKDYGGRGIKVCPEWLNDPDTFARDMGPRPTSQHSIDRIDNDGNYEPGNCRWATLSEQAKNKRPARRVPSVHLSYGGRTQSLIDWAMERGLSVDTLRMRIRHGWSLDEALSRPSTRVTHAYVYCRGRKKPGAAVAA